MRDSRSHSCLKAIVALGRHQHQSHSACASCLLQTVSAASKIRKYRRRRQRIDSKVGRPADDDDHHKESQNTTERREELESNPVRLPRRCQSPERATRHQNRLDARWRLHSPVQGRFPGLPQSTQAKSALLFSRGHSKRGNCDTNKSPILQRIILQRDVQKT